jgi:hypothetical protein
MANASEQDEAREKANNGGRPNWVALLALFISILSFVYTFYRSSPIGEVTPQEVSGYAIVRGVDPSFEGEPEPGEGVTVGPWPSDHVVVPMEWSNSSGSSALVRGPELVFSELGQNDKATVDEVRFFLVGQLPEVSPTALNNINAKPYTFTNTLVLEPHSVSQSFLVFRVEDWDGKNRCFRFHQGQQYSASIEFRRVPENPLLRLLYWGTGRSGIRSGELVERLTILESANWISPYGRGESIGWDFYSLLPGARATSKKPVAVSTQKHYSEPAECS